MMIKWERVLGFRFSGVGGGGGGGGFVGDMVENFLLMSSWDIFIE